ncbi:MAG: ATP-binding protein [Betaproteobacteria bacterium]|nr:ATP-binding protein [Betaproteobacteria bacterium]
MAYQFSSRQGIIAGFAAVIILLSGTVLQGWLQLERLTERNQHIGHQVLDFFTTLQSLDERGIDLERNIQQYRLVRQEAFRSSFDTVQEQALLLIERLEQQQEHIQGLDQLLTEWRATLQNLTDSLDNETESAFIGTSFSRLSELQARMRQLGQQWVDDQDRLMASNLSSQRVFFQLQLLLSFLGAILIAFFIGRWLIHPLHQIEDSIARFGRGDSGVHSALTGPLDIQRLGNRLHWLLLRLRELDSFQESVLRYTEQGLRVPLSALKNNVDFLAEEVSGSLSNSQREVVHILRANLDSLQKQTDHLKMIIERIFDRRGVEKQPVKLRELFTYVVESQNEHPRFVAVKVHVDLICPPETEIWLDVEKIARVMSHLFRNALDFAPAGSEIKLLANLEGEKLVLECHDQGPGILPGDAPHIFEPFYRDRPHPDYNTPIDRINLAIAKELTQVMEGDIQLLETSPGAHFRVSLPYEPINKTTP